MSENDVPAENGESELFLHGAAAGVVVDPVRVVEGVRDLDRAIGADAAEDGVQQRDLVDDEVVLVDLDAVADVVRVLDEDEDAGAEELGGRRAEHERGAGEDAPQLGPVAGEVVGEEGGVDEGDDDEDDD